MFSFQENSKSSQTIHPLLRLMEKFREMRFQTAFVRRSYPKVFCFLAEDYKEARRSLEIEALFKRTWCDLEMFSRMSFSTHQCLTSYKIRFTSVRPFLYGNQHPSIIIILYDIRRIVWAGSTKHSFVMGSVVEVRSIDY